MNEKISALIDDELDSDAIAQLIGSIRSNPQSSDLWNHYHLIGDVMRGSALLNLNFKENLMLKIEQEATVLSPNAALVNRVVENNHKSKPPISWSIAASFAAATFVGWMVLHEQGAVNKDSLPMEVAQTVNTQVAASDEGIPAEYLMAHQSSAPSGSAYYIQSASYTK